MFEFGTLDPDFTFERFVVSPENRFAYAASQAVAESLGRAYNPLFIYGNSGLGKTHLMQAIGNFLFPIHPRSNIIYLRSDEFSTQLVASIRNKVLSVVEVKLGKSSFHTWFQPIKASWKEDRLVLSARMNLQGILAKCYNIS